ncbi:Conjugal transfer protein TraG [compost metagenome]
MQKLTTSNNIEFEDLGNKKTAIYVISPDSHSTYNYILTIFYGQLLQRMYAQADRNGGRLDNPVYLLLDEFANIGKIPDFNQKLSTSRSRGISISIIVQSIDQLIDLYKDLHENIIANCDTQIFLGSKSIKTCEYVSKSLGQKTIKFQSKSISKDKKEVEKQGVSFSEQRQGRELMTIDELMRMNYDEEIVLVRGLKPIKAKKAWYYKYHNQKDIAKQYEIHDLSDMPKPQEIEIDTMDVYDHLDKRVKAAKEKIKEQDVEIVKKAEEPKAAKPEFDLQKELEKKFDELFGASD